jgi:1-acyl-sn-glycerol-3-phosphate acyltransferase
MPFHANLFEAAIDAISAGAQPFALVYVDAQGQLHHAVDLLRYELLRSYARILMVRPSRRAPGSVWRQCGDAGRAPTCGTGVAATQAAVAAALPALEKAAEFFH